MLNFQTLDENLDKYKNVIIGDDRSLQSAQMRHLYEVEFLYESTIEQINPTKCYQLWGYWQPITIDHFKLYVQKCAYVAEGRVNETVGHLSSILNQVHILTI